MSIESSSRYLYDYTFSLSDFGLGFVTSQSSTVHYVDRDGAASIQSMARVSYMNEFCVVFTKQKA